jgi:hypothetical protein
MQFDTDMKSEHKELFLAVRKLLLTFNGFKETKKDRITTYANENGGICHLRTMNHGIDIGFLKGARMEDKHGLLSGSGKVMRVLSLESINEEVIEYYINQAIEINAAQ